MTEKDLISWVRVSSGSAETFVRRGGNNKPPFDSILTNQYICQKLSKSVDVR